jgi:hypothetical protein
LGRSWNLEDIGFSKVPRAVLDEAIDRRGVFASPVVDLLCAAVNPQIREKV